MVEVVQGCQVHSHNMVPYVCLPGQVELKYSHKLKSDKMPVFITIPYDMLGSVSIAESCITPYDGLVDVESRTRGGGSSGLSGT